MKRLLLVYLALVFLTGCAGLRIQPQTAKIATQYVTLKFIEQAGNPEVRRERIKEVLGRIQALAKGPVAVEALRQEALDSIEAAGLGLADRVLAINLVDVVVAELLSQPDKTFQIPVVLGWIEEVVR